VELLIFGGFYRASKPDPFSRKIAVAQWLAAASSESWTPISQESVVAKKIATSPLIVQHYWRGLLLPACGEKVGMRGHFRESELVEASPPGRALVFRRRMPPSPRNPRIKSGEGEER
jgi:hypothetical protein